MLDRSWHVIWPCNGQPLRLRRIGDVGIFWHVRLSCTCALPCDSYTVRSAVLSRMLTIPAGLHRHSWRTTRVLTPQPRRLLQVIAAAAACVIQSYDVLPHTRPAAGAALGRCWGCAGCAHLSSSWSRKGPARVSASPSSLMTPMAIYSRPYNVQMARTNARRVCLLTPPACRWRDTSLITKNE